jgi:Tol biopolymer transport system component
MDSQRVRAQLDRILASATFAGAERASNFLRFVVERSLEGRTTEIKEFVIAVDVLGRNTSFDPKSDPIVRVEAGRLRDRLSSYYRDEGEADNILISLPKGAYVPEFSERQATVVLRKAAVLRLSILPPENASIESFSVSPDGRKLAFTAELDGKVMLWVRALDELESKVLTGTELASYPFWSPDSRWVGFFVPNKMKRVEASGGPAQDVADTVVARGGAWSSEGVIVFCPRPVGVLYQIPANGGTPRPVTSLDSARDEVGHYFPQFLPDGRHFLYLAASSRPGESSIRVASLDTTTPRVLVTSNTSAAYAPVLRGHSASLLFVHDDSLMAQPFDWRRLELGGEPTVLAPEVFYRRWHQARFSVSGNGVLLYQSGRAERQQFGWFDRQGKMLEAIGPRNDYIAFTLSPDERYVAFYRDDDPATACPTIWVMDLIREGAVFRFTDTGVGEPEFTPVWSADGCELLFSRGNDRRMRLMRRALNGGLAKCILDTDGPKFPSAWSSDGKFVTYMSQVPDYQYLHVWVEALGASGQEGAEALNEPRALLQHPYAEASACFLPIDGGGAPKWFAYMSTETGRSEVYVGDFPTGHQKWQISNQGGLLPRWRRDGRELFYLTPDGTLMAVPVNLRAEPEFGVPRSLFATKILFTPEYKTWMNQYAVARDGQRFLVNRSVSESTPSWITAVIPW